MCFERTGREREGKRERILLKTRERKDLLCCMLENVSFASLERKDLLCCMLENVSFASLPNSNLLSRSGTCVSRQQREKEREKETC